MSWRPSSLRWRLICDLLLLQVAVSMVVMVGFAVYGAVRNAGDESGEQTASAVLQALHRDASLRLTLESTEAMRALTESGHSPWILAVDHGGQTLQRGDVPAEYVLLAQSLNGFTRLSLDVQSDGSKPQARLERGNSRAGMVTVVVQTGAPAPVQWHHLQTIFRWIVTPMALVTCLGVMLATPVVVRRGLKEFESAAQHAEQIDVHKRNTSIPLTDVAEEIRPFVHAVNRAFDRLNKDYERQERFLADAAHELRTPIATLRLRIDALPHDAFKARLLQSCDRLGNMAAQLLDLERLRRAPFDHKPVELKDLCERVAADMAPLAIMHRCDLSAEAADAMYVLGDAPSLERALTNLIHNAIEHGGSGCSIIVRLVRPAGFEVADSGPGIPEDERERVVEPFHRVVPRNDGAGLGLHLVSEIAHLHKGRLSIASSELGGARLRIELAPHLPLQRSAKDGRDRSGLRAG